MGRFSTKKNIGSKHWKWPKMHFKTFFETFPKLWWSHWRKLEIGYVLRGSQFSYPVKTHMSILFEIKTEDMILVHRTLFFLRFITIKLIISTYFPLYMSLMRLKILLIWTSGRISWEPAPVIIVFSSGLMLLKRRLLHKVLVPSAPVTQKSFTDSACVLKFC